MGSEINDLGAPARWQTIQELAKLVQFCDDANAIDLAERVLAEANAARQAVAHCIAIVRETRDGFLDEAYATPQPIGSFCERFACDQAAEAIEREFGMGTIEQRRLLGRPTPLEEYRASAMQLLENLHAAPATDAGGRE